MLPDYNPLFVIPTATGVVAQLRTWRDELGDRLRKTDYSSMPRGEDAYERDFYASIYGDAAFSQAATGVLAPLLEGAITQEFRSIEHIACLAEWSKDHHRWRLPVGFWDPHVLARRGQAAEQSSFVDGTDQLIRALRIQRFFPHQMIHVLKALFTFRNKALHLGIEWPISERRRFREMAQQNSWGNWFSWSESEDAPWIASVTDALLDAVLKVARETVYGFETLRDEILTRNADFRR